MQVAVLMVREGTGVAEIAHKLTGALHGAGVRVKLDDRVDVPFGRRAINDGTGALVFVPKIASVRTMFVTAMLPMFVIVPV